MPTVVDFRTIPFHIMKVGDSGKYIGRLIYWKLYVIENVVRVFLNSVLIAQVGPNWWNLSGGTTVVGPKGQTINDKVRAVRKNYTQRPWHTSPGNHDIYYIFLPDLNKIIASNRHLILPVIPDVDDWILRLESIHTPRNVIGHMNWLNISDKKTIDEVYTELKGLVRQLMRSGVPIVIP